MKIIKINKLKNCGIFSNFKWPGRLDPFQQYNLVFGLNGTGKTTLSNVLQCLELGRNPQCDIEIQMDTGDVLNQNSFTANEISIHVFNKNFINENVFTSNSTVSPILYIGRETGKRKNELAKLKLKYESNYLTLKSKASEYDGAVGNLSRYMSNMASNIKRSLRSYADDSYSNYKKNSYENKVNEIIQRGEQEKYLLNDLEHEIQTKKRQTTTKPKILKPRYSAIDLAPLREKAAHILSTTVNSENNTPIESAGSATAEWVRQGLAHYHRGGGQSCPFCEQAMPPEREQNLKLHFNAEYEDLIRSIDDMISHIDSRRDLFLSILEAPDCALVHDHLFDRYAAAKSDLGQYRRQVKEYLDLLETRLVHKKLQSSVAGILNNDIQQLPSSDAQQRIETIVREHNEFCKNHQSNVQEAGKKLEHHLVADSVREYKELKERVNVTMVERDNAQSQMEQIQERINELELEITSHRQPATEINNELELYLGHSELQLEVKKDGYAIAGRDGLNAQPSEGERTAIALIYFLKTLRDARRGTPDIVVLDDPVSSLDSNNLFMASSFIKHTDSIGQLFVLTHNLDFFREMRVWFEAKLKDKSSIYMLDSSSRDGKRYSEIKDLDSLLKDYNSDYHYLFKRVYESATSTNTLETNYPLPNMARRLLEMFLALQYPDERNMSKQIMAVGPRISIQKKDRLIRFLHMHSHNSTISESNFDYARLTETQTILNDLLELIKVTNKDHYNRMVRLVRNNPKQG